ncbi:MAG: sn-glycerol-3-phosphate ABC transporter ATP-binding protein UgpC [Azospirillaceae bacterium]
MAKVSLRNLVKRYGPVVAVDDLNLEIAHREFVVLVGPSGCGKSTTLRMIAGLEDITEGEVWIGDRLVNNVEPKNRNIAMVFQNYALYPHMTVHRNIAFGLRAAKLPRAEQDVKVRVAAAILGLEALLERRPAELSGGQRQRVAMGRAIVRDPQVFLFDEPLSNLDAKLRHSMRTEIKKLHQKVETTMVYVTHDQIEAMTLADRIVIMKDGCIQQVGSPMEVFENPRNMFVASFIGSPEMNLMEATVTNGAGGPALALSAEISAPLPESRATRLEPGRKVVFGLRPEHIVVGEGLAQLPEHWRQRAALSVIEPLGSESLVTLTWAGREILGKGTGAIDGQPGREIVFGLNLEHLHLFDPDSQDRLA